MSLVTSLKNDANDEKAHVKQASQKEKANDSSCRTPYGAQAEMIMCLSYEEIWLDQVFDTWTHIDNT